MPIEASVSSSSMAKVAIIIGIGSRRGIALARFLSSQPGGYELHAVSRWQDVERLRSCFAEQSLRVQLHTPNMGDSNELVELLRDEVRPHDIYNLHHSEVASSPFDEGKFFADDSKDNEPPEVTVVDGMVTLRLLEALKMSGLAEKTRFFQEQRIGHSDVVALEEEQKCFETPSACTKMFSHWTVRQFREMHQVFAVNGAFFEKILACDEQPSALFADDICQRMALRFAEMRRGRCDVITVELNDNEMIGGGDIDSVLDRRYEWSHFDDLAEAMWLALNNNGTNYKEARDNVFATRQFHSLRDFCEEAFSQVKTTTPSSIEWRQVTKRHVVAKDKQSGAVLNVKFANDGDDSSSSEDRPSSSSSTESDASINSANNNSKSAEVVAETRRILKWQPKHTFTQIVGEYLRFAEMSLPPLLANVETVEVNADVPLPVGKRLLLLED